MLEGSDFSIYPWNGDRAWTRRTHWCKFDRRQVNYVYVSMMVKRAYVRRRAAPISNSNPSVGYDVIYVQPDVVAGFSNLAS